MTEQDQQRFFIAMRMKVEIVLDRKVTPIFLTMTESPAHCRKCGIRRFGDDRRACTPSLMRSQVAGGALEQCLDVVTDPVWADERHDPQPCGPLASIS